MRCLSVSVGRVEIERPIAAPHSWSRQVEALNLTDILFLGGACQLKRVLSCQRGPDSEADDLGCLPAKLAFNSQTPFVTHVRLHLR